MPKAEAAWGADTLRVTGGQRGKVRAPGAAQGDAARPRWDPSGTPSGTPSQEPSMPAPPGEAAATPAPGASAQSPAGSHGPRGPTRRDRGGGRGGGRGTARYLPGERLRSAPHCPGKGRRRQRSGLWRCGRPSSSRALRNIRSFSPARRAASPSLETAPSARRRRRRHRPLPVPLPGQPRISRDGGRARAGGLEPRPAPVRAGCRVPRPPHLCYETLLPGLHKAGRRPADAGGGNSAV